ncbi:MAG: hypothetical protein FWH27_01165 [Planctomycetaceae bacterium]|nr:hypothetical protein [Planctomycetaceae bacterium]
MLKPEYAIIVRNKTRLEALVERCNTKAQTKFWIESMGGDFSDYEQEHDVFQQSLASIQKQLTMVVRNKVIDRSYLPSFIFKGHVPFVLVVGQDGLVANTAKYTGGIPIIAVNPDPARFDGVLLPFTVSDFSEAVEQVMSKQYPEKKVFLAEAKLNDGQRLLAFNDLFIGAATHVSARYRIQWKDASEEQSSSGIIVSTQAGSTGWLSSVFNMSNGIQRILNRAPKSSAPKSANLRNDQLFFAVREPFRSQRTRIDLIGGYLGERDKLMVESFMPTHGVIFSDGIESDFLTFNSGNIATIGIASETATLVQKGNFTHSTAQSQNPQHQQKTKNHDVPPFQTIDVGSWYRADKR